MTTDLSILVHSITTLLWRLFLYIFFLLAKSQPGSLLDRDGAQGEVGRSYQGRVEFPSAKSSTLSALHAASNMKWHVCTPTPPTRARVHMTQIFLYHPNVPLFCLHFSPLRIWTHLADRSGTEIVSRGRVYQPPHLPPSQYLPPIHI